MTNVALIDGDVIVYQVGFASDKREYIITDLDDSHKEVARFEYKKDADAFVSADPRKSLRIDKIVRSEPLDHCLHSVKKVIESIREAVDAEEVHIFLSPKGHTNTFRGKRFPEYKANRKSSHKPTHYQEIRDYLIVHKDASVAVGIEADDAMAITYNLLHNPPETNCFMCSIDKDFMTIPGNHYNWKRDLTTVQDEDSAQRFFWTQMLMGDSADNIKGVPKIGEKRAAKILDGLPIDLLPDAVMKEYQSFYGNTWEEEFAKSYEMLYILRDTVEVDSVPNDLVDMVRDANNAEVANAVKKRTVASTLPIDLNKEMLQSAGEALAKQIDEDMVRYVEKEIQKQAGSYSS